MAEEEKETPCVLPDSKDKLYSISKTCAWCGPYKDCCLTLAGDYDGPQNRRPYRGQQETRESFQSTDKVPKDLFDEHYRFQEEYSHKRTSEEKFLRI